MPSNASVKSARSVKVHNTVKLDSKTPVPIDYNGSAFTLFSGQQYIPFFHPDDSLFRTLLEVRLLSPTQDSCLNDKSFYSVGDGLQVRDQVFPTAFDRKINGKRQTIDDILKAVFDSLFQDGNKFIEIVRAEVAGDRFVHVYAHNNMDCRMKFNKDGSEPTHVIRSKNFRRNGIITFGDEEKPIEIPLWTDNPLAGYPVWKKDPGRKVIVERTMIHIKNDFQGVDCYGLPSNFSGFYNSVMEYKATRFNLDNFENNMFLGGVLFLSGNVSKEEEKKITQNIRKMYTGEGKGQRILPISSEGGLTDSKFVPFNGTQDGHFIELDKRNESKIITANNWSKALMDLNETSSLGKGGEYIKNLFKIKFRTVIMPAQQNVLNNFIFPLMQIIDEYKSTKFYNMPWWIKPVIPITLEGLLDVNSLLTVDEGRAEIGRGAIDDKKKGKMLISEVAKKSEPVPGKEASNDK